MLKMVHKKHQKKGDTMESNANESEWTESLDHPGYRVKVVKRGNATIEIYRPILDPVERAKREAYVTAVVSSALSSYYRRMEEKKREQK